MGRAARWVAAAPLLAALVAGAPGDLRASEPTPRRLCAYDPSGRQGEAFASARDFADAAVAWGARLTPEPYTDEAVAYADFRAGRCDAVMLTGLRARGLVRFSGTIEALGAVPSYRRLADVIRVLARPKAAPLMRADDVEVAAMVPAGAVYLFVRDRRSAVGSSLAGKRVATLEGDPAALTLVREVGAAPAAADIGSFAAKFNNGNVDACYAPALAWEPLELQRGVAKDGGVVRVPLSQLTFQVLVRPQRLPAGFAARGRQWAGEYVDIALARVASAEARIPARAWIDLDTAASGQLEATLSAARAKLLAAGQDVYDRRMLAIIERVRHQASAAGEAPPPPVG